MQPLSLWLRGLNEVRNSGDPSRRKRFHLEPVREKREPISSSFRVESVRRIIQLEAFWFAYDCSVLTGAISSQERLLRRELHEYDGGR